jgi:sarcosine oxidase
MTSSFAFDVIVIGRGLLATSSARHLAMDNPDIALIGLTEKQCIESSQVWASHYDNTRVQRIIAQNELWTRLNLESARAWPSLQDQTGIVFYKQNGCIYLNNYEDEYIKVAPRIAKKFDLDFQTISSSAELREISPHLTVGESVFGIYESSLAGLINPRKLVEAQMNAFARLGGTEVNDLVVEVFQSNGRWSVKTASGNLFEANKVLVAVGAFTNYFDLIPRLLEFQNKSEVVIMAQLSKDDYLRMQGMPSLLYEVNTNEFDGIYLTAPTQAPDGSYILKMGLNQKSDLCLNDQSAMQAWFRGEKYKSFGPILERELNTLFPHVTFLETALKPCVISRTSTENPYIGEVDDGLFVAHGCNGYSVMSSDAQGRQAAALLSKGRFGEGFSESDFKLVYK